MKCFQTKTKRLTLFEKQNMQEEIDDQFAGVISGYQTQILLNFQKLKIKIEGHSKQTVYESLIEYKVENPLLKEVKKSFINLTLLFEYINQFSEDPNRINIDLNKCELKIIKNDGLRRLKTAPILIIPLKKRFLYNKKEKGFLEMQIQKVQRHSKILQFTFSYLLKERERILSDYKDIEDWMKQQCKKKSIEWCVKEQIEMKFQKEGNQKVQISLNCGVQLDKMLGKKHLASNQSDESLFFEPESLVCEKEGQQSKAINDCFSEDSPPLNLSYFGENFDQSYDPFSYL